MIAEDAGDPGRTRTSRLEFESAVEDAERHFLQAREAWHAERGDTPPARQRITGLPPDAPQSVRDARRGYEQAREAWITERDNWLSEHDRRSGD